MKGLQDVLEPCGNRLWLLQSQSDVVLTHSGEREICAVRTLMNASYFSAHVCKKYRGPKSGFALMCGLQLIIGVLNKTGRLVTRLDEEVRGWTALNRHKVREYLCACECSPKDNYCEGSASCLGELQGTLCKPFRFFPRARSTLQRTLLYRHHLTHIQKILQDTVLQTVLTETPGKIYVALCPGKYKHVYTYLHTYENFNVYINEINFS